MAPGSLVTDPISAISLGLALMFGTAGLPHILMRFFTVADAKAARKSVFYATGFIGYFYILTFIIGFGAITLPDERPDLLQGRRRTAPTTRSPTCSAAPTWRRSISPTRSAARCSSASSRRSPSPPSSRWWPGLTLAGASAVSHDLYASVIAKGRASEDKEVRISKISAIVIGIVAIVPRLHLREPERRLHGRPRLRGRRELQLPGAADVDVLEGHDHARRAGRRLPRPHLARSRMVVLSPAVWVKTFGFKAALFPYDNPALFSMTIAFVGIWLFSKLDASQRARGEQAPSTRSTCAPRPASARPAAGCTDATLGRSGCRPSRQSRRSLTRGSRPFAPTPPEPVPDAAAVRRPQPAVRPPDPPGDRASCGRRSTSAISAPAR